MAVVLEHDYETYADKSLPDVGLAHYVHCSAARPLMCAYRIYDDKLDRRVSITQADIKQWVVGDGGLPVELIDALTDPHVQKRAFNASFERKVAQELLQIEVGYTNWRCTMVLAYMHGFAGGLEDVGTRMGVPQAELKKQDGKKLINLFCGPQKITKANAFVIHNELTDPDEWERFLEYNRFDVIAEHGIWARLDKPQYPIQPFQWRRYEIDQEMNDRGIPMDVQYLENVIPMVKKRKLEIIADMRAICGLANPASGAQLLPWLRARGYPFSDLQANTVQKVLTEVEEGVVHMDPDAVKCLALRKNAVRTSTAKYARALKSLVDKRIQHGHQYCGAQRTHRDGGRLIQHQNLKRTPPYLEPDKLNGDFFLNAVTEAIRTSDYDALLWMVKEPMDAFADCSRSMIRAHPGKILRTSDLSSIETCVTAWMTGCKRLLKVFEDKRDPYKDFATEFYNVAYDEVEKWQRQICKPPVLGSTYGMGGGYLIDGKKTGLWGYAENMGVKFTRDVSHSLTNAFREVYDEIPPYWKKMENAAIKCFRSGQSVDCWPVRFEMRQPYLCMVLPSKDILYYYQPKLKEITRVSPRTGNPYTTINITYMGKQQQGSGWVRVITSGPKLFENAVQAIAADVMWEGCEKAHDDGFSLVIRVHDELGAEEKIGDNYYTLDRLEDHMKQPLWWAPGLPLGAAGWEAPFYRK